LQHASWLKLSQSQFFSNPLQKLKNQGPQLVNNITKNFKAIMKRKLTMKIVTIEQKTIFLKKKNKKKQVDTTKMKIVSIYIAKKNQTSLQ
jgi:hypothetical protein